MFFLLKNKKLFLAIGLCITFGIFSERTHALSCNNQGLLRQDIVLDKQIIVDSKNARPGTPLWCSPEYNIELTCRNDRHLFNVYNGLPAHLHWNPNKNINNIHPSIELNVKYKGLNINPIGGSDYLSQGTAYLDEPANVTLNYSVCIKATGRLPPEDGKIHDHNTYSIFQIDDQYRPMTNNGFKAYISGLSNISFACVPKITVIGNNNSTINFGTISKQKAEVGSIAKQVPFSIIANMSGQDCHGNILEATFQPISEVLKNNIILPNKDSGIGIFISHDKTPSIPIMLNKPVDFDLSNTSSVENKFFANVQWLSKAAKAGLFSSSANINVTIK